MHRRYLSFNFGMFRIIKLIISCRSIGALLAVIFLNYKTVNGGAAMERRTNKEGGYRIFFRIKMRTKEEMREECAKMLRRLREEKGLSVSAMARLMYVDDHTWKRYEEGRSAPTLPEFIWMFRALGEDALKPVLEYLYPSVYKNTDDDAERLRRAVTHYINNVATDDHVRKWAYLILGGHGSNIIPQLEGFVMIDHLPMEYRYAVAKMILTFYELAMARGELVNDGRTLPDVDIYKHGIEEGRAAAYEDRDSYTSAGKD